jgi:pyruvate/2-oxoglutarate dehydrogenase complex dihydrolipoamide dehydrogenase (E3) component
VDERVERVDVVVVGVGTSGEDVGLRLADAGLNVVGVESGLLGGECAYWACIPSKMMIRAARLLQEARRVNGVAGRAEVTPDWAPVARRIRQEASGGWDDSIAVARFEGRGGRFVRGRGRLTAPRTVTVGGRSFEASRGVVIATGSRPAVPPIPGLADVGYWTTHEAIATEELPASLIVLGGGAVGCELGQVFSRFGVDVTLVEAEARLLPAEEPEAAGVLRGAFEAEGIAVAAGSRVERVEAAGAAVRLTLEDETVLSAERLLVATGRTVELEGLGLEAAGVDVAGGFVSVDDHLRAADGVWALGDVTGKGMFTHTALYQASIVAADILGEDPPAAEYRALPRAVFTDPEVGAVGPTEAQARSAGLDVVVTVKDVPATFRGWLHGPGNEGLVKLVLDRATGILVGATAVGPHGAELLGLLGTAVHAELPARVLRRMPYAFPTFHGAVGEALGAYARGIGTVLDPSFEPHGAWTL